MSCETSAIQNSGSASGLPLCDCQSCWMKFEKMSSPCSPSLKSHWAASGKTLPGPTRLGAVARATITQTDPIIWAKANVAQTWSLERVWNGRVREWSCINRWTHLPEEGSFPNQHLEWHQVRQAITRERFLNTVQHLHPREDTRPMKMCPKASITTMLTLIDFEWDEFYYLAPSRSPQPNRKDR